MQIFKRFLIFAFIVLVPVTTYGNSDTINVNTQKAYNQFYNTIRKKSVSDNGLSILNQLNTLIDNLKFSGNLDSERFALYSDLQRLNNEKIFSLTYQAEENEIKRTINSFSALSSIQNISYNSETIFLENGVWYFYSFDHNYFFSQGDSSITTENLKMNGLINNNTLVYYDYEGIKFVLDYQKVKIISDDMIYGFPNKYELLKTLKENKRDYAGNDDDKTLEEIKNISLNLTKGLYNNDDIIKVIYDYALKNISYSDLNNLEDYRNYSGIETFKSKVGVCKGYAQLFYFLLGFNNIESKMIIGDVFTAEDFPEVYHMWVKIGNYYYDPTYDDPIGATATRTYDKYMYYKIPKDLFYANKYDYLETPEYLLTASTEYKNNLYMSNLAKIFSKYENSNYNILKPLQFRNKYSLNLAGDITFSDLKKIMDFYELNETTIYINGSTKKVKNMQYVPLTSDKIETFLQTTDYDISNYILIYWIKVGQEPGYVIVQKDEIEYQE